MLGWIRFYTSVLITLIAAIVCLPIVIFFPVTGIWAVAQVWSWSILNVCRVELETEGFDELDKSHGYLILANHTSLMDVVALYKVVPFPIRFVAKRELTYFPIFGQVLLLGAAIIVDRGDRAKAIKSVARAQKAIRKGQSILIFPEGTRTSEGELGSFKKGAFYMATEAEVPILPVGIQGSGNCLAPGGFTVRPGKIKLIAGKPIETQGYPATAEGRNALIDEVKVRLRALMA